MENKFRKGSLTLGILLSVSLLMIVFVASSSAEKVVTITYSDWGGVEVQRMFTTIIEKFHTEHPNIRVEHQNVPGFTDNRLKLLTRIAAGTAPDVIKMGSEWFPSFLVRGAFMPLDNLIASDPDFNLDNYYQSVLNYHKWEGKLYGLPQDFNIQGLYYNKKLFDEAGLAYPTDDWSWYDLVHTATLLTKREDARTMQWGVAYGGTPSALALYLPWQNGGEYLDRMTNPTKSTVSDPATVEAIQFIADMINKWKIFPTLAGTTAQSAVDMFVTGRLAMLIIHHGVVPMFREITDFEWDTGRIPRFRYPANVLNAAGFAITTQSKHVKEAWEFLKFLVGPEAIAVVVEAGNSLPAHKGMTEMIFGPEPPENEDAFLAEVPFARPLPLMKDFPGWWKIWNGELEKVWLGMDTAENAAKRIDEQVDELLKQ